jgi:spermidine synthase
MKTETIPNVDIPEGASGKWRVERFTVSEEDVRLHNMRCSWQAGMGGRTIKAGTYTRLMRGSTVVMSDTDAEKSDHWEAVYKAKGIVLINGLGIGMVLNACLLKPEVEKVIAVELSAEVIELTRKHYQRKFGPRVEVIHSDALSFTPPKGIRFGAVWHDIWDNICGDNLPEMHQLHRKYGRRSDWQGSWCRYLCEMNR